MSSCPSCQLCQPSSETVLWANGFCRVIRVEGAEAAAFPGFCRVIWTGHAAEMSDLSGEEQTALMRIVFAVEKVIREQFKPDKINLAALGNMVPHVHWHIIPRWRDDSHFPNPIWGAKTASDTALPVARPVVSDEQLRAALYVALGGSAVGAALE
jgi:diadenosine tetraphosphate (Ap4A) HIT family hydrolase